MSCRVEWQFWTSSNDGCGRACERQGAFKREFQMTAVQFEQVRSPTNLHCSCKCTTVDYKADMQAPWSTLPARACCTELKSAGEQQKDAGRCTSAHPAACSHSFLMH